MVEIDLFRKGVFYYLGKYVEFLVPKNFHLQSKRDLTPLIHAESWLGASTYGRN
jgi:hypothetical protein